MDGFWAGIIGVMVGSALTIVGQWLQHLWQTFDARERDKKRKSMLEHMLENPGRTGWRKMETLSSVIGATRDETAQLLIEIDARASETGNDAWAYIKNKPLPGNASRA